jgi:hypothetical protein
LNYLPLNLLKPSSEALVADHAAVAGHGNAQERGMEFDDVHSSIDHLLHCVIGMSGSPQEPTLGQCPRLS